MKRVMWVLAALLFAASAYAAEVTLGWNFDTQEEPYIEGFRIYYGKVSHKDVNAPGNFTSAGPYENMVDVKDPKARTCKLTLEPGIYYARGVAYGVFNGMTVMSTFSPDELGFPGGISAPSDFSWQITFTVGGQ